MITRHPFRVSLMACLILCLLAGILVFGNLTQVIGTPGEAARATEGMQPAGETAHMVAQGRSGVAADNSNPPTSSVRLIFIHHSTGGNWLADPNEEGPHGGLGRALMTNNYYVSATNYGWGPGQIGDQTDIPNWPEWFTGPNSAAILAALYAEDGQSVGDFGAWPRMAAKPAGENQIILFKSCYPNSDLYGQPGDAPLPQPNDYDYTVANAKAVYIKIRSYFASRPDKLFVAITAPPMAQNEYGPGDLPAAQRVANARSFNNWLVNDWLDGYSLNNVAVFDYYSILTSNGSATRVDVPGDNEEPNDAGWADGNHHRWWGGAVQHLQTISNNYSAYPSGDSHPTTAGQEKATAEFVSLLNVFYNRWRAGGGPTPTPVLLVKAWLPLILQRLPPLLATPTPTPTATYALTPALSPTPTRTGAPGALIQPSDLTYLGAFRLPDDAGIPRTFEYGGNAMTFNPAGDPANTDPYPGSLFAMGHDRMAYGELPDGNQVAEVNIPVPVIAANPADMPQAAFIQGFHNVTAGYFTTLEEIPRVAMQYLNHPATGPKIHLAWGQHFQFDDAPSHAWFNPALATPNLQGVWFIGNRDLYTTNGYLFEIPSAWADTHAQGRYLATGRMRDGGQGSMGPTLFAYRPWLPDGSAPPSSTRLQETVLLLYENAYSTSDFVRCARNYQYPDEWEGGAWITTPSGKSAVLFAGTKSTGAKMWYGYINPRGPEYPCVDPEVTDYDTCRLADGSSCPPGDYAGCCDEEQGTCATHRGWWSSRFDAQFILYNPVDLARVAAGTLESWEPQPYASVDIDEHLFLDPPEWDLMATGWGDQRRNRIGPTAYDRNNGLLYVVEQFGDEAKPVVHVWRAR